MELYILVPDRGLIGVVLHPIEMKPQIHLLALAILPSVKSMSFAPLVTKRVPKCFAVFTLGVASPARYTCVLCLYHYTLESNSSGY